MICPIKDNLTCNNFRKENEQSTSYISIFQKLLSFLSNYRGFKGYDEDNDGKGEALTLNGNHLGIRIPLCLSKKKKKQDSEFSGLQGRQGHTVCPFA